MPTKEPDLFTLNFAFEKIPPETRSMLNTKLEPWLKEQKENFPFVKKEYDANEIHLESEDFLFYIKFGKEMRIIAGAQKPEANIEKLNETTNKIFSFLNTIMPDEYKKGSLMSQFTITEKEGTTVSNNIVDSSQIARMSELLKAQVKPVGILFEWKEGERRFVAFEAYVEKCAVFTISNVSKIDGNISMDMVLREKEIFLKFKNVIEQMAKKDS